MRHSLIVALVIVVSGMPSSAQYARKSVVAHRGSSAYAPEHTLEAYRLAIEQGADYVEQDLQITRDGVLVCLHDETLERTTDVEEIFPDRRVMVKSDGPDVARWFVSDFTLAEIKRLDAGGWFDPRFKGVRVPTWQEAIDVVRGRAGLYPETKAPDSYRDRGFSMETLVVETLRRNGLERPLADLKTPVIIQSFSSDSLQRLSAALDGIPLVLLINQGNREMANAEGLKRVKTFAAGIGPSKRIVGERPELVQLAHNLGLSVTVWTFQAGATGQFASVRDEMSFYLDHIGVDAVFTDNPDQFPR